MDPQNWARCNPGYFRVTYVAKKNTALNQDGDAEREPNPPAAGSVWHGVLFEHFEIDGAPKALFKNLLNVSIVRSSATEYSFKYSLNKSIMSRIGDDPEEPGGIVFDEGSVTARDSGNGIILQGEKNIRFSAPDLGGWAEIILRAMCDEVAGKFGEGAGACCDLGG